MRAIVMTHHGGPEVLETRDLPDPVPGPGEVLIRVRAFGLNHADTYMRSGVWSFGIPVLGIECVGVVEQDPGGRFGAGATVVAVVGGLARDRHGSYAELVTVPATNVVAVDTELTWADLAAIPEVYATAWTALQGNLDLEPGHSVLVRGATSAVGQAAVNLAVDGGATVIATTRAEGRAERLRGMGAAEVLIDDGRLAPQVARHAPAWGRRRARSRRQRRPARFAAAASRPGAACARSVSSAGSIPWPISIRSRTCPAAWR